MSLADFERFSAFVQFVTPSGCWQWLGSTKGSGYGQFKAGGRMHSAHKWLYERVMRIVPKELVLDHTCRNILCVNPTHLEPVTNVENVQRMHRAKKVTQLTEVIV